MILIKREIGDVVIYQIGNKSYARRTFRANNPKTMKQEVRARFLVAIRFYQKLKETSLRRILKVCLLKETVSMVIRFILKNMKVFCADGRIGDFSQLQFSAERGNECFI